MAREELALQTQLLLQEASQLATHGAGRAGDAEASALVEGDAPAVSELEAARQALLDKLRHKKEQRHAQLQQINQRRYGFGGAGAPSAASAAASAASATSPRLTPVKAKAAFKPPVAASSAMAAHKKKDLLSRLRKQAIQQGSQNMAKLFGYSSYEAQIKNLNLIEQKKILESEKKMRENDKKAQDKEEGEKEVNDDEEAQEEDDDEHAADNGLEISDSGEQGPSTEATPTVEEDTIRASLVGASAAASSADAGEAKPSHKPAVGASDTDSARVKRRNRIDEDEDDGNEADSEQDGDADGDEDDKMEVDETGDVPMRSVVDASASGTASATSSASPAPKKDRAAGFRELLRAEALETRRRKRLVKGGGGANFVELEAEEDEEEDALKIGGLGDFGFGVPQAKTQESKEAEEERNALKLREDDLEGIVDDLSDDEQAQQQDLDEIFRKEAEEHDRDQVKEVMRNVKEGFGRNRRAFSAGLGEARGRFNLDELVAADGSKFEAARLGLLESDEEWSEGEGGKKTRRSHRTRRGKGGDDGEGEGKEGEEEDEEEEDEEAEMERMLRERYKSQPQIYVTSSESEGEEEDAPGDAKADADADEANSDEEREKQQMKLFSERARINRRMARMKDLQRQISLENGEEDSKKASEPVVPNLLLEEDEDSQELLKILNRTDVTTGASAAAGPGSSNATHKEGKRGTAGGRPRPMLGRFNSFGAASSFNRVAGNCTLFNAGSGSGQSNKGFVFTSLGSERPEQVEADNGELPPLASRPELGKSKSWGQPARRAGKRGADAGAAVAGKSKKAKPTSDLFSVLSSYQVSSSHSAPL